MACTRPSSSLRKVRVVVEPLGGVQQHDVVVARQVGQVRRHEAAVLGRRRQRRVAVELGGHVALGQVRGGRRSPVGAVSGSNEVNASTSVTGARWYQKWSNSWYISDGCSTSAPFRPSLRLARGR